MNKAFDTVNIHKLIHINIPNTITKFIINYIKGLQHIDFRLTYSSQNTQLLTYTDITIIVIRTCTHFTLDSAEYILLNLQINSSILDMHIHPKILVSSSIVYLTLTFNMYDKTLILP